MTSPINKKTFSLVNRISNSFDIIIDNFSYAATLLANFRSRIIFIILPAFVLRISYIISLKRIRLLISQIKLIVNPSQTISLRRIKITYFARERLSNFLTIFARLRMNPNYSARQKLATNIIIKKIILNIDPTLAEFFTLGYFDPSTLGTLDSLTLGDMDYTIS